MDDERTSNFTGPGLTLPALGLSADIGPFGTSVDAPEAVAFTAAQVLLAAAFREGATRVSLQATSLSVGEERA